MKNYKNIVLLIVVIVLLVSCENNNNYKNTIWNISFRLTENKEDRLKNDSTLYKYLDEFGIIKELYTINFLGYDSGSIIRGIHGWLGRTWIRAYEIRAPFMEKPFEVWIDNRTHEIFGDNFCDILSTDDKFQHLYSNWVKKQVGIDDEDVELKFAGNFDKPYIEFDKITTLSEDYREVFENTHNLYAWLCEVKNIKDLDKNNILDYAQKIREDYLLKAISKTGMPSSSKYYGRLYLSKTNDAREKGISYIIDFDIIDKSDSSSELKYAILK